MIVVSDTSPLNYLVHIGHIGVLPGLFGRVLAPPAVIAELRHPLAPEAVQNWASQTPTWLEVRRATVLASIPDVDQGEAEAIALAMEVRADAILIDDARGREAAKRLSLFPQGHAWRPGHGRRERDARPFGRAGQARSDEFSCREGPTR